MKESQWREGRDVKGVFKVLNEKFVLDQVKDQVQILRSPTGNKIRVSTATELFFL